MSFDLSLGLELSLVIVTGAGGQIGQVIVDALLAAGCCVGAFEIDASKFQKQHKNLHWVQVDTTNEDAMQAAWRDTRARFDNRIPTACICAAGLDLSFVEHHESAADMPVEQFRKTLEVNTTGTFVTAKTWLRGIRQSVKDEQRLEFALRNVSLIIVGSEAGVFGVPSNADYAASKSAIQYGMMLSLAADAARIFDRARVNAIAPGAVDTPQFRKECKADAELLWLDAQATVVSRKPVSIDHVARTCLMLVSEKWSGGINGQVIRVDEGKSGRLFWDRDGAPMC